MWASISAKVSLFTRRLAAKKSASTLYPMDISPIIMWERKIISDRDENLKNNASAGFRDNGKMLYLKKRLSQNLILSFFADVFIVSLK
jgi:hypothetical protein